MLVDECFPKEIIFVTQQSRIQDFGSAGGLLIEEGDDILTWWGGGALQGKAKTLYERKQFACGANKFFVCFETPLISLFYTLFDFNVRFTSFKQLKQLNNKHSQTTPRQQRGWFAEGSVKSPWSTRRKR